MPLDGRPRSRRALGLAGGVDVAREVLLRLAAEVHSEDDGRAFAG